ncbi:E3 ubiquitin-protein ligase RSL1-like [Lotus japonicus]|uniref:E3 ubiquitin-protein ligase RSL1-like n=1 Tax=Lotus japonicus TaxID=34305 RepID=UPI00258F20CD|nr:E3 ubiquitin-protein ligase RSL1-like [Lotus japonicus]
MDDMDETQDLQRLLSEHRRELTAAEAMESDLDFAYRIQLQEALAASVAALPSSSSSTAIIPEEPAFDDAVLNATSLQLEELARMEQEMKDLEQSKAEMQHAREDLVRRIHDQKMASEILAIPERDWEEWGDNYEKAFGEGCSSGDPGAVFRVYFKGLVSEDFVNGESERVVLGGIGIAICDEADNVLLEVSKPLLGTETSKKISEAKALIEAFNAAIFMDLKRVVYYCDYPPLLQHLSGKWPVNQQKLARLVNEVYLLQRKFTYCNPRLVARHDLKYAFKLARDAIVSQSTRSAEAGSSTKSLKETCVICLEDTDINQFFSVDGCQHRYCFSCVKQHVEVKLLQGMVPKCPHEGCKNELLAESCRKFLPHKLIETMQQRKVEASIPVTEKIYCPYPRCSALMSKTEVLEYSKNVIGAQKQCIKCRGFFCFICKVPWHNGMTCHAYKKLNPNPPAEDLKLKSLATRSLWRQCVKCNHMIELAEGCYHMTCRCGYEFCYQCGAGWKDKKATCSCPLWAEEYLVRGT